MTRPHPKAFAIWFKDLELWNPNSYFDIDWKWPAEAIRPLSSALERRQETIDKKKLTFADAPPVTIRFDGSMEARGMGNKISFKGNLFAARAGNVVYSKIDVRNGAIGIVPESLPIASVTAEFPVYQVKPEIATSEYIQLLFKTDLFRERINSLVSGASGRKRVQPEQLEALKVPLPPLETQRAIVQRWQEGQAEADRLEALAHGTEHSVEMALYNLLGVKRNSITERPKAFAITWKDLERWSFDANFNLAMGLHKTLTADYQYKLLGEISTVSYGIQKSPANRPGQHARPYLRVANVRRGFLDLSEIKEINVPDSELNTYSLMPGDILFVEGNGSKAELGRVAVWNGEIENCVHQNHLIKVRVDKTRVSPEYAMTWFNSKVGRSHFFRSAKTSSGLGTINSSEVRSAPIPLPPLETQRDIVRQVQAVRQEAAAFRGQAAGIRADTKTEIEHLILGAKSVTELS